MLMRDMLAVAFIVLGLALAPQTPIVWELQPKRPQPIPVRVTYYNLVQSQTDDTPEVGSCGHVGTWREKLKPGWYLVAVSRDLFYREGSKRCGDVIKIVIGDEVIMGVVWDTTHRRFVRTVDIAMPPGSKWKHGATNGLMYWEVQQ